MISLRFNHVGTIVLIGTLMCGASAIAAGSKKQAGMPSGLRKDAAYHLLTKYRSEGTGKPEISAKPFLIEGTSPAFRLRVRYPTDRGASCFTVQSGPADEEGNFRFSVETHPGSVPCDTEEKLVPYRELEQMMARIRICEQKGDARCVVSDPASSNRQVLMLR